MIRSAILYHVYSGHLFFTAVALFILGLSIRRLRLLALLALPLALLSGTPMPWFVGMPALSIAVATLLRYDVQKVRLAAIGAALVAAGLELPWHFSPTIATPRRIFVLGDSLASGGFGETRNWVERLGATGLASPSETVASARVDEVPPFEHGDILLIELGGNDMLDRTPLREFEQALDALLARAAPRRVVMLELPLVPGAWGYGAIQRRLAAKHGAALIPKRLLAKALTRPGATSDGLHLTDRGHELLAHGLAVKLGLVKGSLF